MIARRSPAKTVAWIIVAALSLVLIGEIVWGFMIAPRMRIRHITLESDLGISDGQLLEMLDLEGETWAGVDELELAQRLEAYPVVRKAQVVKVFPDTLKLYIYRRKPLVITLNQSANGISSAVFDEDGYAVQVGSLAGVEDLPIISGPRFGNPEIGARFPDSMQSILADLSVLRQDEAKLFALISEIEILPQQDGSYDLKLYLNHIAIPVLVDRRLSPENIRRAILVVDVLSAGAAGEVGEADVRGGNVVYRRLEES